MTELSLGEMLHKLTYAYKRTLRQVHQEACLNFSMSELRVLKTIQSIPDCTSQAVVSHIFIDKAQVARAVNQLLAAGLIDKVEHPADRRSHLLALTSSGIAMVRRLRKLEQQAGERLSQHLSPEQVRQFITLASHLTDDPSDEHT